MVLWPFRREPTEEERKRAAAEEVQRRLTVVGPKQNGAEPAREGIRGLIGRLFGVSEVKQGGEEAMPQEKPPGALPDDVLARATTPAGGRKNLATPSTPPTPGRSRKPKNIGNLKTDIVGDLKRETGLETGKIFYYRITCGGRFYRAKLEVDKLNGDLHITFQDEKLGEIGSVSTELRRPKDGLLAHKTVSGRESILREILDAPLTIPRSTSAKTMREVINPGEEPIVIKPW